MTARHFRHLGFGASGHRPLSRRWNHLVLRGDQIVARLRLPSWFSYGARKGINTPRDLRIGHPYGGVVITEAGIHPKVSSLVYITAFAPDRGESVASLIANPAPGAPVPPILPPKDGYLFLDRIKFAASFAADVEADMASFMADENDIAVQAVDCGFCDCNVIS